MRTHGKRLSCLLIAAALLAGMSSCGSPPQGGVGGEGAPAAESGKPYEFTYYFNYDYWDISQKWGDDLVTQYMNDKFNIKVNIAKPDTDPVAKLNTMVASDDLPELIMMDRDDNWRRLIKLGKLVAVDQYFDQNPAIPENLNPETIDLLSVDEHLYGVPNWPRRSITGGNQGYAYALKTYEQVGSPRLETLDDLLAYARAVKQQLPTINGSATIPIITPELEQLLQLVTQAYGGFVAEKEFTVSDGKMVFKVQDPLYQKAILYANQLYREGLISRDLFSLQRDQVAEQLATGATGIFIGNIPEFMEQTYGARRLLKESDPGNDYMPIDFIMDEGVTDEQFYGESAASIGWNVACITNKAEQPEKIFDMLSWMMTQEGSRIICYGPPGEMYDEVNEDGMPILKKYVTELSDEEYRHIGLFKWTCPGQSDWVDGLKFGVNDLLEPDKQDWTIKIQSEIFTPRMWNSDEFNNVLAAVEDKSDEGISRERIREYMEKNISRAVMAPDAQSCEAIITEMEAFLQQNGADAVLAKYTEQWEKNKEILGKSHLKS